MTLLRVHDHQQDLTKDFVKMVKSTVSSDKLTSKAQQQIFIQGQEMGFCNDEIRVLIEDYLPGRQA